jgi:hypothetical protein
MSFIRSGILIDFLSRIFKRNAEIPAKKIKGLMSYRNSFVGKISKALVLLNIRLKALLHESSEWVLFKSTRMSLKNVRLINRIFY